ncbi:MAG: hypothetical protein ACI4SH_02835, partial [Candidatus Scatosoma sp.]
VCASVETLIERCKKDGAFVAMIVCYSKSIAINLVERLYREGIHPLLTYIQNLDTVYPYSSVVLDYAFSFYRLLKASIRCGAKKIAFVGYNRDSFSDSEHKNILLKIVSQTAAEYRTECKIFSNDGNMEKCLSDFIFEAAAFDTIICANDIIAVLLSERLKNYRDYNIIGFGGMLIGRKLEPVFSSTNSDFYAVGVNMVETYLQLNKMPVVQSVKLTLKSDLILSEKLREADAERILLPQEIERNAVNDFYRNDAVEEINQIENMLLGCDNLDLIILKSILNNEKYAQIETENYLAVNTIKYRLNNMIKNAGVKSRKELVELIRKYNVKL